VVGIVAGGVLAATIDAAVLAREEVPTSTADQVRATPAVIVAPGVAIAIVEGSF